MKQTKNKTQALRAFAVATLLLATGQHLCAFSGGYSIGLNFGPGEPDGANTGTLAATDRAGILTAVQGNWNNLPGANGEASNLVADDDGASVATTASVVWASNGTWSSTGRGEENNAFTGTDRTLMIGYLDTGAPTTTTVTIQNIPEALTSSGYDVIVYGLGGVSGRGGSYRVLSGPEQPLSEYKLFTAPANPSEFIEDVGESHETTGTYIVFNGISASTLVVEATTAVNPFGGTPRAPINAIQLVELGGDPRPVFRSVTGNAAGFTVLIDDVGPAVVNASTVTVTLDGESITPSVAKEGARTTIRYDRFGTTDTFFESGSIHNLTVNLQLQDGAEVSSELAFTVAAYATIPPSYALAAPATTPGFVITKVYQTAEARGPGDGNSTPNAEMHLAGGMAGQNISEFAALNLNEIPIGGTNPGGPQDFLWTRYVNWERAGGQINPSGAQPDNFNLDEPEGSQGVLDGAYANRFTPGVELGAVAEPVNYTVETIAYIQLARGLHRWGVNSDDGFKVTTAPGQPSPFGIVLGEYSGGRGATDTPFDFVAETDGVYPIRLLYWQGGGGASAEWFSINLATGEKILIDDTDYHPTDAYRAFRSGQGRAYISAMRPSSGFTGTSENGPIFVQITDGRTQASNARLLLNGVEVATGTKAGNVTTINYTPPSAWPFGGTISGQIVYSESGQAEDTTQNFSFNVRPFTLADLPANTFWIEAEDWDHSSGQTVAAASTMPYAGGAYEGLVGVLNVDYFDDNSPSAQDISDGVNLAYRTDQSPNHVNITVHQGANVLAVERPGGFTMTTNYRLGWVGNFWGNYTRTIPAGNYRGVAALSHGDGTGIVMEADLDRVTDGVGTANQTLQRLGTFIGSGSGGWGSSVLIPLKTPSGADAIFTLPGGPVTLRVTARNGDFDWFALTPTTEQPPVDDIRIENIIITPGGQIQIEWTGEGTLQSTPDLPATDWTDITSNSPATIDLPATGRAYFRVQQ